ncbi:unnamed protein product [Rotaria sp. Silwood2]|nr:unnamed protein product [Rotaria sp. Silwood2]
MNDISKDFMISIIIYYSTSNTKCKALQWLTKEQAVDRKYSYMFSQCQAIYAHSLYPCQDTLGVKSTFTAKITCPKPFTVLMTGLQTKHAENTNPFYFEQQQAIPSDLIAIAVGQFASHDLSPRIRNYMDSEAVKIPFDVAQCDDDSLYTYLPNWLNSLKDDELQSPPMSSHVFQKYIRESHLETSMANSVRKMALNEDRLFTVDDFEFGRPLGKGAFGIMLHKSKINVYSMAEQVKIETESGFKLNHPLILTMYDVFHDEKHFYFMLEYAPHGQLYQFLQKLHRFTNRLAASYIYEICHALEYCYSKSIIHRDLKPENILLDLDCCGNLKLADFDDETKVKIATINYIFPDYFSQLSRKFIDNLLQKDPKKRMSLLDCITHDWLQKNAYKYMFGPYKCSIYVNMNE